MIQGHVMFLVHFKYIYTLKLSDVISSAGNFVSFVDRSDEEDIEEIAQIEATIADNVVQREPLEMAVYEIEQQRPNVIRLSGDSDQSRNRRKRKITSKDVLQLQHEVLLSEKEALEIKKQKLRLQVLLLQQQVDNNVLLCN